MRLRHRQGRFRCDSPARLEAFRADIAELLPFLADRVGELKSWDDIRTLTVVVDRLRRWHRPGLLAIGDAAHAMSPIGGVGINLAIQDAVAAANILTPLKDPSQKRRGLSPQSAACGERSNEQNRLPPLTRDLEKFSAAANSPPASRKPFKSSSKTTS